MTTSREIQTAKVPDLEAHIQEQLSGQVRDLRLIVQGQGLILRGQSQTYYGKQLAQEAVLASDTLPIIANEIEVI